MARAQHVAMAAATLLALLLAGCLGEQHLIDGQMGSAYRANGVVEATVAGEVDAWGERGVALVVDEVLVEPAVIDAQEGETIELVASGLDVPDGTSLLVFIGVWDTDGARVSYAVDSATDAPAPGFDEDLPSGVAQDVVLDCLADAHGTVGAHRRAEALVEDTQAREGEAFVGDCIE